MKNIMKSIILLLSVIVLLGCTKDNKQVKKNIPFREGVVIHLTKGPNNPDIVIIAMNLAIVMSEKQNVIVYLDCDGVKSFFSDSPDMNYGYYQSTLVAVRNLSVMDNVKILASKTSLRAASKSAENLIKGITAINDEELADLIKGNFFTIDY